ncbi:retinol dehydrogenase 12-like [Agrilus planipennis]|uniref:NADP-retinol dehydrogenase n=1 Tax=Agrilus planipennis TaxID=224129 RepID=A0A1W4WYE7_AGRPL|nr:retinol dehydrogenase 12-like [Agrilus planipennis]
MVIKITKPVLYTSAVASIYGAACLFKEYIGGEKYSKDIKADGKIVIVTGANTGIGKETAWELARRGAKVYMACRDMTRCENAREEIVLDTKNKYVYCRECDLSSLESIRKFVQIFNKQEDHLDILINNAGVMRIPKHTTTREGFEMQLGVNHMGHFLLTNLLLDQLKKAAPSRIVNVSSIAHKRGKINKEDLNSNEKYDPGGAYAQSKLANILFTKELAKRLEGTGVTVYAVHPGLVDTEIIRHMGFFNSWMAKIFIKPFVWPFIKTPTQGAQTIIFAALDPSLERVTGKYFSNCSEAELSEAAKDDATAKWLWLVSEKWTRLSA